MLQRHLVHDPGSYNELIVDTRPWVPNLPETIAAFFFSIGRGFKDSERKAAADSARRIHDAFNRRYWDRRHRTPLVSVDLDARGQDRAFKLVVE